MLSFGTGFSYKYGPSTDVLPTLMSSNGEHLLVKFQIKAKIIFCFEVAFLTFQVALLKISAYLKIMQAYI